MKKEDEILSYIRLNPYITQQELAEKVDLSRSAVANHIRTLMNDGKIIGRAYVVREESTIVCIGGMNIDRKAKAKEEVVLHSSNPVEVMETDGGVAKNIAENLCKLNYPVTLISAVGNDKEGKWLLNQAQQIGIDTSNVIIHPNERTGSYTTLLDGYGETVVAMADMNIYDSLTEEMLENTWMSIENAKMVCLDLNFPSETIHSVMNICTKYQIPLCLTSNSAAKIKKLPEEDMNVSLLVLHKREMEQLFQKQFATEEETLFYLDELMKKGIETAVMIENYDKIWMNNKNGLSMHSIHPYEVIDDTGIMEAFIGAVVDQRLRNASIEEACHYGLTNMKLTASTTKSVYPHLSKNLLQEAFQTNYIRTKSFH